MTLSSTTDSTEWVVPKGTILIVDDDEVNGRVLARMVEMLGYRTFVVNDGAQAISALEVAEYDAALMDCHMPVMDGYEATRKIRAGESGSRRLPIIAVTAASFPNDRQKCIDAGMDDFVAKPVMQGVLARTLERALSTSHNADVDVIDQPIDAAPVNTTRVDGLQQTFGDEFLSVLATFCTATYERIQSIDVAINNGDEPELRRLIYAITGGAKTFGADGVAEAARLLQLSLLSDDRTLWADAAWRLRNQYGDFREQLLERFQDAGLHVP